MALVCTRLRELTYSSCLWVSISLVGPVASLSHHECAAFARRRVQQVITGDRCSVFASHALLCATAATLRSVSFVQLMQPTLLFTRELVACLGSLATALCGATRLCTLTFEDSVQHENAPKPDDDDADAAEEEEEEEEEGGRFMLRWSDYVVPGVRALLKQRRITLLSFKPFSGVSVPVLRSLGNCCGPSLKRLAIFPLTEDTFLGTADSLRHGLTGLETLSCTWMTLPRLGATAALAVRLASVFMYPSFFFT